MERWIGKVAVVTGASAGIGAAIAEELVRHGMKVVGFARRVERVQALADKLSGEKGKLYAVKVDISNEEEVKAGFKWLRENLGAVHVLVNNAGILERFLLTEMESPERMRKVFETNVIGLSLCTGEAIRLMNETGVNDGHIIHISSLAGQVVVNVPGLFPYGATKHALRVLTEGLRRELVDKKTSIRVTGISPGLVKTDIFEASGSTSEFLGANPHLNPKDIADCVIFALGCPSHVQIHELTVRPVGDPF